MIALKDFASMFVSESLLDDIDIQMTNIDKSLDTERAQKWSEKSRRKPWIAVQKKGYALYGDFKIDDIKEKKYTGTPINRVTGNVAICDCDIETLEGIFTPNCEISGTFAIEDCPNLVSLKGSPIQVGTMVINYNKKLKSLEYMPVIKNNLYLNKNGKKFNRDKIKEDPKIYVGNNIFCSNDTESNNIINEEFLNESFKAPQLRYLADAIKKVSNSENKPNINNFLGTVALDEIKSSDIYEYSTDDPDVSKLIKQITQRKRRGFFYVMDNDGNIDFLFNENGALTLNPESPMYTGRYSRKITSWTTMYRITITEILNIVKEHDIIVFVDTEKYENVYNKQINRREARRNALVFDKGYERKGNTSNAYSSEYIDAKSVRYYQEIADKNRERYRTMLMKLQATRATQNNNFNNFKKDIDSLFDRYTNLLEKMIKNPKSYTRYDLNVLHNEFSPDRGLMHSLNEYFKFLHNVITGGAYYVDRNADVNMQIKNLEIILKHKIEDVNRVLKNLESI